MATQAQIQVNQTPEAQTYLWHHQSVTQDTEKPVLTPASVLLPQVQHRVTVVNVFVLRSSSHLRICYTAGHTAGGAQQFSFTALAYCSLLFSSSENSRSDLPAVPCQSSMIPVTSLILPGAQQRSHHQTGAEATLSSLSPINGRETVKPQYSRGSYSFFLFLSFLTVCLKCIDFPRVDWVCCLWVMLID